MEQHSLTQIEFAKKLGVSQQAVQSAIKRNSISERMMFKLESVGFIGPQKQPDAVIAVDSVDENSTDYYRGQADMAYRMYKDMLERIDKVLERTEVALSSKQHGYRTGLRNPVGGHERKGEKEQTRTEPKTVL
jgi:transcriptional regulator with XRE-family HTH domain